MKNSPRVSILLSVRNGGRTLETCLASIHSQTWRDFELLCMDDGSRDDTHAILERWEKLMPRSQFRIFRHPTSLGLTMSLNELHESAQGGYIARIDADDVWVPEKLRLQIDFLETHPECGVVGSYYTNRGSRRERVIELPVDDASIRRSIYRKNPFGHSCVIMRTGILKQVGGYNEHLQYSQDRDLWYRLLPLTRFYNLPYVLCIRSTRREHSQTNTREQIMQSIKISLKYMRLYRAPAWNYVYLLEPGVALLYHTILQR